MKTRLGRYLNRVRRGHSFVVTDRNEPVAELRPIGGVDSVDARLASLAALGLVTLPSRRRLVTFAPLTSKGPLASDLINRDRDERP